jgi:hypothetical protein
MSALHESLASLILLATLTTMSGIILAQAQGIIDRIAKEQGCWRTMEELHLQQRQMSGKGSPKGSVYCCIAERTFWTTIISSSLLTFR